MPFNPTDELSLKFTVTEWNQILAQLQEGPWKIVAPIINKINLQAAQQEQQSLPKTASVGFTNGELVDPAATPPVGDIVADVKIE